MYGLRYPLKTCTLIFRYISGLSFTYFFVLFCVMPVSELAASLEESRDELQVAKRKNTALIKVSIHC